MKVLSSLLVLLGQDPNTVTDLENFLGGLVMGLIQKDDLAYIMLCLKDGESLEKNMDAAIADFEKGDTQGIIDGIEQIGVILQALPQDLGDCKEMQSDLDRIEKWAQIFQDPTELVKTVTANVLKHHKAIMQDISDSERDFNDKQFYPAGKDVADILVQALGPVPKMPEDLEITQW